MGCATILRITKKTVIRKPSMAIIMIKCPKTGKDISTGMAMDKASFQSSSLSQNITSCPHCGNQHTWDKKDAWLQD